MTTSARSCSREANTRDSYFEIQFLKWNLNCDFLTQQRKWPPRMLLLIFPGFDDVRGFYSDDVKVRSFQLVIFHLGPDYGKLRSTSSIVNVEKTRRGRLSVLSRLHLLLQLTQSKEVDFSEQGNNRLYHFKEVTSMTSAIRPPEVVICYL